MRIARYPPALSSLPSRPLLNVPLAARILAPMRAGLWLAAALAAAAAATAAAQVAGGGPKVHPRIEDVPFIECQAR